MPPLIHTFKAFDRQYVFDANANTILPLDDRQALLMNAIEKGEVFDEAKKLLDRFREQGYFLEPDIRKIEHPETNAMKYYLTRKIQKLTLQVTQSCNLRCDYCFYSDIYETRPHAVKRMTFETAKKAIDYVLRNSIDEKTLNFGFYGGEPLLEMDLIYKCISYIREKCGAREISFTITTNGTLLTCEVYERLVNNNVDIWVSLDGPKPVHDSARKYPDGRGSFDDIIENILNIQAKYPDAKDKVQFLAVAHPEFSDSCAERLYTMDEILPDYGINLNFVSEIYTDKEITYSEELSSIHRQEWAKLYLFMLDKLDKSKVSRLLIDRVGYIHTKYRFLRRIKNLPPVLHPGGPCLAGVHRLFVSADGVFYPCERVSETSEMMKIGDVDRGINVEKANAINNIGKITAEECKKCWAIQHCTLCAAFSDGLTDFSREKRLKQCVRSRWRVEELLICCLSLPAHRTRDHCL
jgi:uncharacterized protein